MELHAGDMGIGNYQTGRVLTIPLKQLERPGFRGAHQTSWSGLATHVATVASVVASLRDTPGIEENPAPLSA